MCVTYVYVVYMSISLCRNVVCTHSLLIYVELLCVHSFKANVCFDLLL